MRACALCQENILKIIKETMGEEGIELQILSSPQEIPTSRAEIYIIQFPVGKFTRGDIFINLESLWDVSSPLTIIIKPKNEKIRKRDIKDNVTVIDDDMPAEEIKRKIKESIKSRDFLLHKGLEAYAERDYATAYEYWMRLAKSPHGKETKVYEYLKIARKEFQEAGIDTSELENVLEESLDPFKEGTRLYSEGKLKEALRFLEKVKKDDPQFMRAKALIENIKEELELEEAEEILNEIEGEPSDEDVFIPNPGVSPADLTPKEAFILSLIDGESNIGKISKIAPMKTEEFKRTIKKLLNLGLIRRK